MSETMFSALDAEFEKFPVLVAGPTSEEDVERIESYAGFTLPSSYRAFILRYGGAIVGPYSIYGKGFSEAMGSKEASVIDVTERFRAEGWPGAETTLIISADHAGNAIMMDDAGHIICFDHDNGETERLADDFVDFVLKWCLRS